MAECIAEDDLLDLAQARRGLGDAPALEAHLADCQACSALLCSLVAAHRDAAPRADRVGRRLGPYRLDGLLGAGAMGEVYRGWDERLHRHVAVKVLAAELAASPDRVRRLEAEGRAAAAIAHPNVVTVYDTGTDDGVSFVVSELIAGESLRSAIDRGPIARTTAIELGLQLARGLAAAHAQGVVHRDLKPGNLIITDDGTLKIIDFGLAKVTGERAVDATEPGTLLGTSGYLSPEQARGEPADARSDLFAVGAILHELLTGQRAFGGATFAERLSAVLRDTPAPIDDPVGPIVQRCLEKDPRKRFQSAHDLAWVLEGLRRGDPPARTAPTTTTTTPAATTTTRPTVSRRAFLAGAAATGAGGVLLGRALSRSAPARPAFAPEYRQLTFRQGRVASARFTPDGGSILYAAAWEDQPAAIYTARLGGGGTRPLALPPAQLLAVSARGQLALSLEHRFIEGFHQRGQLAVAPLEGGTPRGLGVEVQDADFTPDGEGLAIVRRAGARFRLELPVGRTLLEGGWLAHPRVSPDGAQIACLVHDGPDDDRGDVVVVARTGGAARTVASGWSSVDGLAWAPDGRSLWISASVGGSNNAVWQLALDGRRLAHLPSAGRLRVHDAGAGGTLAVTHTSGRVRMMVKAPGAAVETDLALSDIALVTDLSADGQAIVFVEFGDVDTANGAYLRSTAGGAAVRLGDALPLDLADDGRGVLALTWPPPTLVIYPVPEGPSRSIALPALAGVRWGRWCAGDRLVVAGAAPGRPARVWRSDLDGRLAPLTGEGVAGTTAAVSPDGRAVAVIADGTLWVVDVDGAAPVAVPGTFADEQVCGWWRDGSAVLVGAAAPPVAVRRVDVRTGAATVLLAIDPPPLGRRGVTALAVSPDGDAYAYSYSQELSRLYTMTTRG